ncbi:YhdH/YhfP family quinone oxidoreductase [Enterococcus montenegrensis]|uniref:YhdH/YhfP family quinone oxidoreductase n=1 Tax=Enterococcus montenegrensis TaxID=3031993 RepID=UPI00249ECEF5|nr:YhdH/YhfP family quinone oxidoreductase [Enterococcus montenegrensis]WHA09913.1 YhdH/YhfP family quinone oxidoreductase [Enterococcus montenegrensis]
MTEKFQAFVVNEKDGQVDATLVQQDFTTLNTEGVIVKVAYSSLNFKDALATQAKTGVVRSYPLTLGIDLAGTVVTSNDSRFVKGDEVLATGYGLGVSAPGGLSHYQSIPGDWLVPLPAGLSLKESMVYGTAGFTAALAVEKINQNIAKNKQVLVTGASGGVGSIAIALLHKLGYEKIIAVSRKDAATDWLKTIGATEIITPDALIPEKIRPLAKQQFSGIIDTVGGDLLAALLPQLDYEGVAALCGNASGIKLNTTVLPFILRGIKVFGIDSVNQPMPMRQKIWNLLATDWKITSQLKVQEAPLYDVGAITQSLLAGKHEGRTIISM